METRPIKRTISATSLSTFLRCQTRYARAYLGPKQDEPKSAPMLAGTGFHKSIETAIKDALSTGGADLQKCIDAGLAEVSAEYQAYGLFADADDFLVDPSERLDEVYSRVRRSARWYLMERFGDLRAAASEVSFSIPLEGTERNGLGPWHLTGKIDCIEEDGSIRDFKLSNSQRPPDMNKADKSLQLTLYSLARWIETGRVPPRVTLDYTRDLTRMVSIERVSSRTEADVLAALDRVRLACSALDIAAENDTFVPCSPEDIFCDRRYCPFHATCKYGGGQ